VTPAVDLNSDLGEGFGVWNLGDDKAMLEVVTSANVVCGFHAGDPDILGGEPVLFLIDHPVTGGHPVVAVVKHAASTSPPR
jgi:UPF0271 protein